MVCKLIERLADFSRSRGIGAMVTFLYGRNEQRVIFSALAGCIERTDVALLDPYDELEELRKENPPNTNPCTGAI